MKSEADKEKTEAPKGGGGSGGGGGGGGTSDLHPLIAGLVQTLPKQTSDPWPLENRVHWLQIAVNTFSLLYGPGGDGEISITVRKHNTAS